MTYNPKIYGILLADVLPGIIDSEREYERLEIIFNDLINKGEDNFTPEENRLFALLANLLEDYEKRTLPELPETSAIDTLRFLMSENNLKQKDVADIFGSQGITSEVLNGKREISKTAARRLSERFNVSAELFI